MKTKFLLFLFAVVSIISCSKDDDTPEPKSYPEENPLALFLKNSGYDQKTNNLISTSYAEQGFKFQPKVKGKIKAVTLKIPNNSTNIPITVWNADTQTVITSIMIPEAKANTEVRKEIESLEIIPTVTYFISFNEDDIYSHYRSDGKNAVYPIDANNITILGSQYKEGKFQEFPSVKVSNYYYGDVSIVFQQTE